MGGKGSGRSGYYAELDFEELVKKSLTIQLRFFDNPDIPDEKKVEYASRYLAKRVGEKIELAVSHSIDQNEALELINRVRQLKGDVIELPPS